MAESGMCMVQPDISIFPAAVQLLPCGSLVILEALDELQRSFNSLPNYMMFGFATNL